MDDMRKCCGTCLYHKFSKEMIDWYCSYEISENYTICTPYDGCCEEWEER